MFCYHGGKLEPRAAGELWELVCNTPFRNICLRGEGPVVFMHQLCESLAQDCSRQLGFLAYSVDKGGFGY